MRRVTTTIDKIVVLCRDVQRTSAIYSESLGFKVYLQSPELVELRDSNNLKILLKSYQAASQLGKGYSPIISLRVEHFDQVRDKLIRSQLIQDGEVVVTNYGKIVNFVGPEGEHISINSLPAQEDEPEAKPEEDKPAQEIKNLLSRIRI